MQFSERVLFLLMAYRKVVTDHPPALHLYTRLKGWVVLLFRAPQRTRYLVISGSGARWARSRLYNQSSRRMKLDSTCLRRGFFLESGYARLLVSLALRSPRQNRSIPLSALRKNSPAASTASMANMRASTALAPVTDSSSCRSPPFKGLPFAATILVRHFPGVSSNAVISRPLYCIARPLRLHRDAKVSKGLQLT